MEIKKFESEVATLNNNSNNEKINIKYDGQYVYNAEVKSAMLTELECLQDYLDDNWSELEININDYFNADELADVVRKVNECEDDCWEDGNDIFTPFRGKRIVFDDEEYLANVLAEALLEFMPTDYAFSEIDGRYTFFNTQRWIFDEKDQRLHDTKNEHYSLFHWHMGGIKDEIQYQLGYLADLLDVNDVFDEYKKTCEYKGENWWEWNKYIFRDAYMTILEFDGVWDEGLLNFILPDIDADDLSVDEIEDFAYKLWEKNRMGEVDLTDKNSVVGFFERFKDDLGAWEDDDE